MREKAGKGRKKKDKTKKNKELSALQISPSPTHKEKISKKEKTPNQDVVRRLGVLSIA